MVKRLSFAITFALATLLAHGESSTTRPLWQVPAEVRTIERSDIIAKAKDVTPATYPDADTVCLDSVTYSSYNPDGTSVVYDDTYTKILTEKGRRSQEVQTLYYNIFYGIDEVIAAEIISPDGQTTQVDIARYSVETVDSGSMSSNIYDPNDKILRVTFPNIEIGDIVRFTFKSTISKARVPGVWSDYQVLESTTPILRYSYYISSPADLPLKRIVIRDQAPTPISYTAQTNAIASTILHTWHAQNVDQIFPEPNMPPMHTTVQRVLTSTLESWKDLSKWYWNLSKPHLDAVTDEMKDEVKRILAESGEAKENKIWNIFTFVSQQIRYMGITTETESPGYEPHDASETFSKRYGVCRDKAALLVSMLRLAGIDAFPVLVHAGEKRDPYVPMTFFNHAIVGVRDDDGTYSLMDPTNENARDLLPGYLADKSYLVATPEGEDLRTSDPLPASANMLFVNNTGSVDQDGRLALKTTIDFDGVNDSAYRGFFLRNSDEKRRKFFETVTKRCHPGAKLENYTIIPQDLQDTEEPLSAKLSITVEDYLPADGNAAIAELPWFTSSMGYVNFLIESTGLKKRRFPFVTEIACGIEEATSIKLSSPRTPLNLPAPTSFKTNGITFFKAITLNKNTLTAKKRFEINQTTFPTNQYLPFKENLAQIEKTSKEKIVLADSTSELDRNADKRILSKVTAIDLASANSWTTTVSTATEILKYAGRRNSSELKLTYNPAWQEVELLSAVISNKNGAVHTVRKEEINIMDASWAASAPRYSPSKTMVVSLPGVEIGSTIHTTYRFIQHNAPFFFNAHSPQGFDPANDDTYIVTYPQELTLKEYTAPFFPFPANISTNAGRIMRTYHMHAPQTLPREDNLPETFLYRTAVFLSNGNWVQYRKKLSTLIAEAIMPSNSTKAAELARSLTKDLTTQDDKVKAIRDYVAIKIRVAGPSFTDLPLAVAPADTTLKDGYGNLLDRTALLYAMLKAADLPAFISLVDTDEPLPPELRREWDKLKELPSTKIYTRPTVEIYHGASAPAFPLNDLNPHAPLWATTYGGHDTLLINFETLEDLYQKNILFSHTTRMCNEYESKKTTSEVIELDNNGNAIITVTNLYYGVLAGDIKKQYAEITPEKFDRLHQEMIGNISIEAEAAGPLSIETNAIPYSVSYSLKAPNYATISGDILTLSLKPPALRYPVTAEKRTLPIELPPRPNISHTTTIILPPETKEIISSPSFYAFDSLRVPLQYSLNGDFLPEYFFNRSHSELWCLPMICQLVSEETLPDNRKKITIRNLSQESSRVVLPPEEYKTLLETNRKLSSQKEKTVIIRIAK